MKHMFAELFKGSPELLKVSPATGWDQKVSRNRTGMSYGIFNYSLPMTYQALGIMKILYIYSIQQCSSRDEFLQSKFMQDFLEF